MGKRELLARGLLWSGAAFLLSRLTERNQLLVLNYHRIGNPALDPFDPAVFSATESQFDDQVSYLKRRASLVTLEEAVAFASGSIREPRARCRVLLTFDDGYLDNYQSAFPILRSHGVQGVFFLITSLVGSSEVPWWDRVAWLLRKARRRRFTLHYPADLPVDLDRDGLPLSLRDVLRLHKRPGNTDPQRFLDELQDAAASPALPAAERRFLNWDEAREMVAGGMAIGSHTHSHIVLSQLSPGDQHHDLARSRSILQQQLGVEAETLAYPVGKPATFSQHTQQLACDSGYRAAFSFHGGVNLHGRTSRYDIKRVAVDGQSRPRFRVQASVCRLTGKYWP